MNKMQLRAVRKYLYFSIFCLTTWLYPAICLPEVEIKLHETSIIGDDETPALDFTFHWAKRPTTRIPDLPALELKQDQLKVIDRDVFRRRIYMSTDVNK